MFLKFLAAFSVFNSMTLATEIISVGSFHEIESSYHRILQSDQEVAFHIMNTQTVLVREPSPLMEQALLPSSWPFWPKPAPRGQDSYWLEMEYNELVYEECTTHYFPVSHCQTQENDAAGSVTFSYTVSNVLGLTRLMDGLISYTLFRTGVGLKARFGLELDKAASRTGETSCKLLKGQTGQILVQPLCATVEHRVRSMVWKDGMRKLVYTSTFGKYQKVKLLLAKNALQLHCATNDIANLLCEGNRVRSTV